MRETNESSKAYRLKCTETSGGPKALAKRCRKRLLSMVVRLVWTLEDVVSARRRSRKCSGDWRAMGDHRVRHGQTRKGDGGDQGGNAAEQRAEGVSGRRQSQRVTRARYAAIGDWRGQGVMASAGGVFCSCYLMAMLPLRRRSRLGAIGGGALAVSRRDRSPLMGFAADLIQPYCRHYEAGAAGEYNLLTPRGRLQLQPQSEPSQCRDERMQSGSGTCSSTAVPSAPVSTR
jgi:hypothetical protein